MCLWKEREDRHALSVIIFLEVTVRLERKMNPREPVTPAFKLQEQLSECPRVRPLAKAV